MSFSLIFRPNLRLCPFEDSDMKVQLIQPAQLDDSGNPIKYKQMFLPSGTLATVAALTPSDVDVSVIDEYVDTVDFDADVDLVGITGLTCHAPRAYQIAAEFRKRGKTVVMGGIHASALPDEALEHVDSVVVGEAEDVWETVVRDAGNGGLLPKYRSEDLPDLKKRVIPRFDLTNYDRCIKALFADAPALPIHTTRGCPYNCDYCSVTRFFGGKYRTKPIDNVLAEIEASGGKDFFFLDDNIAGDPSYAEQLFKEMAPLKLRWFSQASTTILKQPKLAELAGAAGCHEFFMGIESIDEKNLASMNKSFNKVDQYAEVFRMLKSNGITTHASVMFGLDNDNADLIDRTVDFLLEHDVNFVRMNIATPYPGTGFYDRLSSENRITETDWSKYDLVHCVFRPKHMDQAELEEKLWSSYARFYSCGPILKRLGKFSKLYVCHPWKNSIFDDLLFQLHFYMVVRQQADPLSGILDGTGGA